MVALERLMDFFAFFVDLFKSFFSGLAGLFSGDAESAE